MVAQEETSFGRYHQIRRLAGGATGAVYLVEDGAKAGPLALKILAQDVATPRLVGEFAHLTELSHPNIVRVRDAGILNAGDFAGRAFLVMDYVDGPTLAEWLAVGPPAEMFPRFAKAAASLTDALAYLHAQGLMHGDISPANIRCDESGQPVLIDFGLAHPVGPTLGPGAKDVSGTLGYMAPEVLLGERGLASDLFALGATLYDAWTGAPPFGLGLESVKRIWQGPPAPPSSLRPGMPFAWDTLLLGLIAAEVEDRPASAREALKAMRRDLPGHTPSIESDLGVPFPVGDPLAGIVVGRADEQATLRRRLEHLSEGAGQSSVVCVVGPPGSGKRTLLQRVVRDVRMAMIAQTVAAFTIEESSYADLLKQGAALGPELDALLSSEPEGRSRQILARIASGLEARAQAKPLCVVLAGSHEDRALAQAVAGTVPSGRLLVLLPCEQPFDREGTESLRLSPLSRAAIADLARRGAGTDPPLHVLEEIVTASAGLAGACALLVRSWIARLRGGETSTGPLAERDADLAHLLDSSFASLSKAARVRVLDVALSTSTGGVETSEAAVRTSESDARAAGWLDPAKTCLPSALHWSALWRALASDPGLQSIASKYLDSLPDVDVRAAEVLLAVGDGRKAAMGFWRAMREDLAAMAWSKVAEHGLRALASDGASGSLEDRLAVSGALGILGRYEEGLTLLDECKSPSLGMDLVNFAERKAWLLGRRGDPDGARKVLASALDGMAPNGDGIPLLRARLARVLVASGRYAEALTAAEPATTSPDPAGRAAREAVLLALAYSGQLAPARGILDILARDARAAKDVSFSAKVAALEGLVSQLEGQPGQSAKAYEEAVGAYEQVQDLHGAAVAVFNLGCCLAETGDYGKAINSLERAVRELGRLGAVTDHALAVFNVGQLFLQLGDVNAAERSIGYLEDDARVSKVEGFLGYADLLKAQVQRKRGSLHDAVIGYRRAGGIFARIGMAALAETAEIEGAEVLGLASAIAEARSSLARVEQGGQGAAQGAMESSATPRSEAIACARARIALAEPVSNTTDDLGFAAILAQQAESARALGRLPAAWRLASLAAQLFARRADPRQHLFVELARSCFKEVTMQTPAKYWSGLEADSEASALQLRALDGRSAVAQPARSGILEGHLRRLLRINKRLNSDLRLSRVLETIIDTVIELTDAERGFLLLKDNNGELVVKVARNIDQTTLEGPSLSLSRSIAKRAADSGEAVITVDATGDSRFSELLSVSDLHLRSVLAVPLAVKGQVVGTIYVDHRLRKGVFGDDELAMVLDFADQGAIAIENARMVSELRRREQQVQSLNHRLERELKDQEVALSDARVELKESRQAAALRYDYRQIIGQSPCMVDLFRLLDRVTDTSLPVVIEGESGTGKELVARAIHFHGPRKDRAFVSENCAAIPETLLESALFGHVRGAFTGADREARGLFAIANGGTLFLDEVAEMSPGMQGKLLRVLQEGEFHRVGGERPEKVDVRVLVATNKNLTDMVESGKFRKDLFYRLSVVRLHLPPLRERSEDIPLLLRHFLEKASQQGGTAAKTIDASAMAKLCRYAWPGNVRELENEIARAGAFAGATVGVSDLSPHIQSGQDPNDTIRNEPDSLRIRHRVERLERQLIRESMNRSQGNQTKAAALLGLSRFGLQKKLRRYGLAT